MREPGQLSAAEGPVWTLLSGKSPWQTHPPQSMGVVPPAVGTMLRWRGSRADAVVAAALWTVPREPLQARREEGQFPKTWTVPGREGAWKNCQTAEESDLICPISIVTKGVKTVNKRRCCSGVLGKGSPSAPSDAVRLQIAAQQINCRLHRKAYLLGKRSSICFSVCNLNCSLSPGLSFGLRIHSLPQGTRKLLGAPSRSSSVLGNVALPLRHL